MVVGDVHLIEETNHCMKMSVLVSLVSVGSPQI